MNKQANSLEQFIERSPAPERRSPEQERYEEKVQDAQEFLRKIQAVTNQYDPAYIRGVTEVIVKQALDDTRTVPHEDYVEQKIQYGARMALGLIPLEPMHQEQGEQ